VPDSKHYPAIIAELARTGSISAEMRKKLAAEAFAITSRYDTAIAGYLKSMTE